MAENNFLHTYNKILNNTRIFYESINKKDIVVKEVLFKNFYQHLVKIKDDTYDYSVIFEQFNIISNLSDIIFESHFDAELNKKLINLINHTNNFQQIKLSTIFDHISNKLKVKYNLKLNQDMPVYIFKFDFSNPQIIFKIFCSFNISYQSQNLPAIQAKQIEKETFKKYAGESAGLYYNAGNCLFIFLNTNKDFYYTESTINHQIYHLLQDIFNIHIDLTDKTDFKEIKSLQLNQQQLKYLYKRDQFENHIKVELINQLEEVYWKFYKNKISKAGFITTFIYQCEVNPHTIYENEIIDKILFNDLKNKDLTAIRLFLSTFLISDKSWNKLAIKWLKEKFN